MSYVFSGNGIWRVVTMVSWNLSQSVQLNMF